MAEDYKIVNEVLEGLSSLVQDQTILTQNANWYSTSWRCLNLTKKICTDVKTKFKQISEEINPRSSLNKKVTIEQLFRLLSSQKTATEKNNNPQKIETPKQKNFDVMAE